MALPVNNSYNILLLINQKYFEMAKLCIHSLLKNADIERVNHIFIGNIGLDDNAIKYFEALSTKIVIVNTGISIAPTKDRHTKEWVDAVSQKTRILREIADNEANLPLVVMDVDQIVISDFSHLFDPSKDIQVCKREKPAQRPDMTMDYIGSFFVVNNRNALPFLDRWIERIGERIAEGTIPAYETPALCETIKIFKDKLAIGELSENVVSCNNNYVEGTTCIIHMKSETAAESEDLVSGRVNGVQNYDQQAIFSYASFNSHTIEDYIAYKKTRKAKVVIYTAVSSHFDNLIQHTYISKEFDYVCYTDQQIKDPGIWEVRPLDDRGLDRVRSAKYYKVFPNKFFTDYDYSIWIDGNIDVLTDELEVRVKKLITSEVLIAASKHFERDCVYQEANVCILNELDDPDIIEKQVELLRKEGFPENQGLFEMNIIYRNHQDHGIVSLMQAWWEIIVNYSKRDQLSFMYVLWKQRKPCNYLFDNNPRLRFSFSFHEHNKTFYSSISIDSGNDFNKHTLAIQSVYVGENNDFVACFPIENIDIIKRIIFKPTNNKFCIFKVEEIKIGSFLIYEYNRNAYFTLDGWDYFYTTDPIYTLEGDYSKVTRFYVKGKIRLLTNGEVNAKLFQEIEQKNQEIEQKNQEIEQKNQEIEQIINSKSWKITAPLRFLINTFKRIFKYNTNDFSSFC